MTKTSRLRSIITPACARFITNERGATAIEYAMIAAGIGAFISATVFGVGSELKSNFYDKLGALFP
jgi:pilus assembly protein Flp/PilA